MTGLNLTNLAVARGEIVIVPDLTMDVPAGQVTVLLGPNGAGKTTLLEAISGVLPTQAGTMHLGDIEIQRMSKVQRARAGVTHVQQGRVVFPTLTVEENMRVGAKTGQIEAAFELFPELIKRRHIAAGSLSGGEQQMVVLARAILAQPQILLVDEMSLGLAPLIVRRLMPVMRTLANEGMGVLLVEQFAQLALSIGDTAFVMNQGRIQYSGPCQELLRDPDWLHHAYLGVSKPVEIGD